MILWQKMYSRRSKIWKLSHAVALNKSFWTKFARNLSKLSIISDPSLLRPNNFEFFDCALWMFRWGTIHRFALHSFSELSFWSTTIILLFDFSDLHYLLNFFPVLFSLQVLKLGNFHCPSTQHISCVRFKLRVCIMYGKKRDFSHGLLCIHWYATFVPFVLYTFLLKTFLRSYLFCCYSNWVIFAHDTQRRR